MEAFPEMSDPEVEREVEHVVEVLKLREVNAWRRIFVAIGIIREVVRETGAPIPIVQTVIGVMEMSWPRETTTAVRDLQRKVFGMKRKAREAREEA